MTHGWTTKKTAAGYRWTVTRFVYGQGTEVLHSGVCPTRARAERQAKNHVMPYRRAENNTAARHNMPSIEDCHK